MIAIDAWRGSEQCSHRSLNDGGEGGAPHPHRVVGSARYEGGVPVLSVAIGRASAEPAGEGVGGVPVQPVAGAVVTPGGTRVGMGPAKSWTSRNGTPASSAAVMAMWRRLWGLSRSAAGRPGGAEPDERVVEMLGPRASPRPGTRKCVYCRRLQFQFQGSFVKAREV